MSRTFRRFEILLPRRFNDGASVPDELIADALDDVPIRSLVTFAVTVQKRRQ